MKKLLVLTLALLMLLPLVGCKKEENTADDGALYVMTRAAYYDEDGICTRRFDYTYDNAAQMLEMNVYLIEYSQKYDPALDCYVHSYDANSPLNLRGTVQREYDEKGNLTVYRDPKSMFPGINGTYAWDYKNGRPESFTITYQNANTSLEPVCFEYDKSGNIIRIYSQREYGDVDYALYEYDKAGRLTQEISATRDGSVVEKIYTYENSCLSSVQLSRGSCYWSNGSAHWADNLSVIRTYKFRYDSNKNLTELEYYDADGNCVETAKYYYDDNGYPTKMKSGGETQMVFTCDEHGNITKIEYADGTSVEYEYKAMKVTGQQAAYYRRRLGIDNRSYDATSVHTNVNYDVAYYILIPNPLFDLPYFLQFLGD